MFPGVHSLIWPKWILLINIKKTFFEVHEMKHTFEIQKCFIFLFPNYLANISK